MNEVELGHDDSGTAPRLIQEFGGVYRSVSIYGRPLVDVLRNRLHRMDGDDRSTIVIYVQRGTPKDLDQLDMRTLDEYIQSAGSADALLIEIKRSEAGGLRQYAVGRDADEYGEKTVSWTPDYSETVPTSEVFTADQALPVYLQWCWDQTVPDGYNLRLLDI